MNPRKVQICPALDGKSECFWSNPLDGMIECLFCRQRKPVESVEKP